MDNKVYEFIDNILERTQEEKVTGYKKKIQNFTKALGGMMEDVPENYFAAYMQESIKTLQMFNSESVVLVRTPTSIPANPPDIPATSNLPDIPATSNPPDIPTTSDPPDISATSNPLS